MKSGPGRKLAIGALAAAAVMAVIAFTVLNDRGDADRLILSGTIEADEIHVGSKVGGRVAEVLVQEGQTVAAGQPLIRFEAFDLTARRADAQAALARAEANYQKAVNGFRPEEIAEARAQEEAARLTLEEARNGPRRQEIEAARADFQAADADYEVARASLRRTERLVESGVASRQDYDNARATYDRAAGRREAARQRLALLEAGTRREEVARAERLYREASARRQLVENGTRREDIEAARAEVERARAALQQIDTQIAELEVRAPAEAVIEVMQVRPGDLINAGAPVATLVEVDRLWVRVYVPEPQLGYVHPDQEVAVRVDTFPGEDFAGRIEHVASRGEFTPRNVQTREEREHQVFGVRVRVDNRSRRLRAGMAADVEISK